MIIVPRLFQSRNNENMVHYTKEESSTVMFTTQHVTQWAVGDILNGAKYSVCNGKNTERDIL